MYVWLHASDFFGGALIARASFAVGYKWILCTTNIFGSFSFFECEPLFSVVLAHPGQSWWFRPYNDGLSRGPRYVRVQGHILHMHMICPSRTTTCLASGGCWHILSRQCVYYLCECFVYWSWPARRIALFAYTQDTTNINMVHKQEPAVCVRLNIWVRHTPYK